MEEKKCCLNCRKCYEEYGCTFCKEHEVTLEDESNEACEDWEGEWN